MLRVACFFCITDIFDDKKLNKTLIWCCSSSSCFLAVNFNLAYVQPSVSTIESFLLRSVLSKDTVHITCTGHELEDLSFR